MKSHIASRISQIKMAKAVRIVSVNKDKSYQFDGKSLEKILLANEDLKNRKIVPISVSGAMRTGKSFILNYSLRFLKAQYITHDISNWLGDREEPLKGFEWRGDSNRVTCGILMWSEVFLHDSPALGKIAIVLMDTQGLFDNQTTLQGNSVIFALSSMVVSMQIYNVMNNLNENDLQLMQLFAEYGKAALESTSSKPFQKLKILVRDWNPNNGLPLGAKGGRELIDKRMDGDASLKSVREDIYASFEDLDGFLMRHPGDGLSDHSDFDGRIAYLHQIFVANLKEFIESVLKPEKLVPKQMHGEIVTVAEYVNNFKFYAKFFSENELPAAENFMVAMANNNALNAMNAAVEQYRDEMRNQPENIGSLQKLDEVQLKVKEKVLSRFDERTKFGKKFAETYRVQLLELLQNIYKEIHKKTKEVLDKKKVPITPEEFIQEVMNPLEWMFKAIFTSIGKLFSFVGDFIRSSAEGVANFVIDVGKKIADEIGNKISSIFKSIFK